MNSEITRHVTLRDHRVALYARTSAAAPSGHLEQEVARLREHVERAGGQVPPDCVFSDVSTAGASAERAGIAAIKAYAKVHRDAIDILAVSDPMRLSRDPARLAHIIREPEELGMSVHFVRSSGEGT